MACRSVTSDKTMLCEECGQECLVLLDGDTRIVYDYIVERCVGVQPKQAFHISNRRNDQLGLYMFMLFANLRKYLDQCC